LPFTPELENRVEAFVAGRQPYVGLHLRFTDRSLQAPSQRATMAAVKRLSEQESVSSVFVAADSPETRDEWMGRLQQAGLEPWSQDLTFRIGEFWPTLVPWLISRSPPSGRKPRLPRARLTRVSDFERHQRGCWATGLAITYAI
jgi:hypothetical protein